ncbi:hypothetical protein KUL25_02555 [Rhodobacteraceae bacterium N5(2021)]|uniref:Lipoprotein n=1 Tax=Gymnodinialimonas phycosphaerae TaxID=2841589 RepID=A0A975TX99_9RHOB|nr:hypothetical protein [Gymnodinialimonas phycosphaerae]MBY4891641.1 hypothetical protein [Gymnodinialimonas phycosphaerae]
MLRAAFLVTALLSLAACDSRINPLNWFGGDREQRITVDPDALGTGAIVDGRILAAEITQLAVEQTTSGAIVRATGVTPAQGYFNAELVLVEATETLLAYEFRVVPPLGSGAAGLQTISVGAELTVGELAGIRTITVIAQNNRRSVGRR